MHSDKNESGLWIRNIVAYFESRSKISKLAINILCLTLSYGLLTNIVPVAYTLWFWQVLVSTMFLLAAGVFVWHETIGEAKLMKPLYELLHRITGDAYYKKLFDKNLPSEVEHE